MESYLESLAGKQGEYSQAMRETQVAFTEALEPTLKSLISIGTGLLEILQKLIGENKSTVVGITATTIAFVGLVAIIKAAKVAMSLLNKEMLLSPTTWIVAGIAALVGISISVANAVNEHREAQARLNEVTERYNKLRQGTLDLNEKNIQGIKDDKAAIEEYIEAVARRAEIEAELSYKDKSIFTNSEDKDRVKKLKEEAKALDETAKSNVNYMKSFGELNFKLGEYNKTLDDIAKSEKVLSVLSDEKAKTQLKDAASMKLNVEQNQKYLDVIRKGQKNSTEYQEAQKKLAEVFPEVSTAQGIIIEDAQKVIDLEKRKADATWESAQSVIKSYIDILNMAKESKDVQNILAEQTGKAWTDILPELNQVLAVFEILAGKNPDEVGGIKPTEIPKNGGVYQNKALDNYKKQLEYKKNLDKISAEDEIKGYEYALRKLAKTNDEKMDLEVKIYQLRKQLAEDFISVEKETLDKRTENSERWIEEQKQLMGVEFNHEERITAYERIIQYHKDYLDKMVADERLSLKQKDVIWNEEITLIKEYQMKIRDARIEVIDNTTEALKDALIKQANQLQDIEEGAIEKSLASLEESKKKKLEIIQQEYDAKIKAIDDELKALEDAERQKSRLEEETEYEKKKKRLEELIAYEHDSVTKTSYEKELSKLNAEYAKALDKQALEDKKAALSEEKSNLKESQQNELDILNSRYEKDKEYYNTKLKTISATYDKEREMSEQNARQMILNAEQNQTQIISLLHAYGDQYSLIGSTWGEKVAQAFEEKVKGIIDVVDNLNNQINNAINSRINSIAYANTSGAGSVAQSSSSSSSISHSSVPGNTTVVQNNTFEVPVEKPSTLLQKTKEAATKLGELLRK